MMEMMEVLLVFMLFLFLFREDVAEFVEDVSRAWSAGKKEK